MNLSTFITHNMDAVLADWDAFARTLLPAANAMSDLALRDHAREILQAVANDIEAGQKEVPRIDKSIGNPPGTAGPETAAAKHGALRHAAGFDLMQLGAEYRALRASVTRLWMRSKPQASQKDFEDMLRFNEAIDQALADSIARYAEEVERSRILFIGMLGHDLRAPLGAIAMSCQYLLRPNLPPDRIVEAVGRVSRSADAMKGMINELLDFARSRLGKGMPITRSRTDMRDVCSAVLDDMRAAHPRCEFMLDASGELVGDTDAVRVHQLLWNLLSNAAQHGTRGNPITLTARSAPDAVLLQVKNHGPAIPVETLQALFNPLVQFDTADADGGIPASLGLGLFIAHEIARAHGGEISATSSEQDGTVFTARLPRKEHTL